jgi:uncharacterized protein
MVREIGFSRISILLLRSFLGIFIFSSVACSSFIYFPREPKKKFYDPSQVGLKQEEVEFENSEGTRIHGWWFESKTQPSKGTVIFFHGNAENLTTHFLSMAWLPAEGYNYFIFDYPGYGVSEGKPTPYTALISGRAALHWVHDHKDQRPLIVYGQSLGGNVAFRALLDTKDTIPYRALILDGTFLSYRSVARQKASESWVLWLFQPFVWLSMNDTYAPHDLEKRAPVPLLVIHGQKDPVIHPKYGEEIFAKSPEPKQIWRIENGRHGDSFWGNNKPYRQKLLDFLQ